MDLAQSLDHVGPKTRTAIDAGLVMQVISGEDSNDPTSLLAPVPNLLDSVNKGIKDLKIGWDEEYSSQDIEADFAESMLAALNTMHGLGAEIVEVSMPKRLREYLSAAILCLKAQMPTVNFSIELMSMVCGLSGSKGTNFSARDYVRAQKLVCFVMASYSKQWRE